VLRVRASRKQRKQARENQQHELSHHSSFLCRR
jgi:hypothetical protein